jgi:hypothetical protein
MSNLNKRYRDRHNDERRIVYYLRRHLANLKRILDKAQK